MSDNTLFMQLENELNGLLSTTSPAYRRKLTGKLARAIRADQQKRIRSQQNADGSAYEPRKRKVLRAQQQIRFIHRGDVRTLRNWQGSKGRRGKTITGFDEDRGAVRTFYRQDIERFLDINFSSVKRSTKRNVPMFRRLRAARFLHARSTQDSAIVGFQGKAAAIAREHQYGLEGAVNELARARYPKRELLGLSEHERLGLLEMIYLDLVGQL
ncbi:MULTISPECIES: phage virion morphogenesis protein [Providencia]|uniref:phage virion morphogenesis protein n=1 Tax=Providencia TaxID=586 RepID=UPI001CEDBD42|nr:phage virion morphogenesis protein [Providencia vermicola]